jgi:hypothetical protein
LPGSSALCAKSFTSVSGNGLSLVAGRSSERKFTCHYIVYEVICDIIEKEFEQKQLRQGDAVLLHFPPESFLVYPVGDDPQ